MNNLVAIDFETANQHPTSICSVGAVKVVDGIIVERFYSLVHPHPNFYIRRFTDEIHGLSRADTDTAPTFDVVWPRLKEWIGDLPLVAHNSSFDSGCLRATLRYYGFEMPTNEFLCTLSAARRTIPRSVCQSFSLPHLADFMGIPFSNHHNALSDAEACAKIAIALL